MSANRAARIPWPWRLLAAVLVILFYFLPCYQTYLAPPQAPWPPLTIHNTSPAAPAAGAPPFFSEDLVNQARPGVICHVSAITPAGQGRLLCTWYAGSREAAPDVAIYGAFFEEGTGTWTEPKVLVDRRQSSLELKRWVRKIGNAVVMNDRQGGLWLFYASMLGGWSTATLNYKVSRDGGQTWTPSLKLLLSPFFNLTNNVKNKGIGLSQGALLLPVYHELLHKFSQVLLWRPDDVSHPYELRRMTLAGAAIQPALIPGVKGISRLFSGTPGHRQSAISLRHKAPMWASTGPASLPPRSPTPTPAST